MHVLTECTCHQTENIPFVSLLHTTNSENCSRDGQSNKLAFNLNPSWIWSPQSSPDNLLLPLAPKIQMLVHKDAKCIHMKLLKLKKKLNP